MNADFLPAPPEQSLEQHVVDDTALAPPLPAAPPLSPEPPPSTTTRASVATGSQLERMFTAQEFPQQQQSTDGPDGAPFGGDAVEDHQHPAAQQDNAGRVFEAENAQLRSQLAHAVAKLSQQSGELERTEEVLEERGEALEDMLHLLAEARAEAEAGRCERAALQGLIGEHQARYEGALSEKDGQIQRMNDVLSAKQDSEAALLETEERLEARATLYHEQVDIRVF